MSVPRKICIVTGTRAEYGLLYWLMKEVEADPDLELQIIATGMHLSPEFGLTYQQIEADGFTLNAKVEMLLSSDSPAGIGKSMGVGVMGFADALARLEPDIMVVLGDRFEILAAVCAALPFTIPIAHISGGEATEGLIDEPIRHSITKMSHLHFVALPTYGQRVIQMGEEPWRVILSGAPGLDTISRFTHLDPTSLAERHGIDVGGRPLVVTYHPVTLEYERTGYQIDELLAALEEVGEPVVFTYPNADTSGRLIIKKIEGFVASHHWAQSVVNLGAEGYLSLLHYAKAMVGNSSSGIIEAASFQLPVVNIGSRQRGREQSANVIDSDYDRGAVAAAIKLALSPEHLKSIEGIVNPYGDGHAAERIVERLKSVQLDDALIVKPFHNLPVTST